MDKIWSIKFNKPIDGHGILDNIKVENSKGKIVKTTVEADNNIVEVNPPVDGYKSEGTYILEVLNSIKSMEYSKMKTSYEMKFTIKKRARRNCLKFLLRCQAL